MASSSPSSDNPSSPKHPKLSISAQEEEDADFISKLPDPLLCHILSLLPTRNAVATSILCKRWLSLWTWVHNVEFYHDDVRRCGGIVAFEATMDKFLASRGTNCCINSFCVELDDSPDHLHLGNWISEAINRNVQEFELQLFIGRFGEFEVPRDLFNCKTLVGLKLVGSEIRVNVPSSVDLPNLKVLHLLCVQYEGEQSVCNLLAGCPVLEQLFVQRDDWNGILDYEISSPSLRSLTVEFMSTGMLGDYDMMTRMNKVHLTNLCRLVEAYLDLYPFDEEQGPCEETFVDSVDVLRSINHVKSLHLSKSTMEAFRYAPCENFPAFDNLERLKLDVFCCYGGVLQKLLRNSPVLKHLSLGKRIYLNCDCGCTEQWMQQSDVPNCLSFHLKTICFEWEFCWMEEDDIEFAGYMLRNSLVLEKLTIRSKWLAVKRKIEKLEKGF